MKIAVVRNRFANTRWPKIHRWVDPIADPLSFMDADFFVYLGPDAELMFHPDELVKFRQNEVCGLVREAESYHVSNPASDAPIGYPKWSDQFFVLKAGEYELRFLEKWRESRDVSATVWGLGVQPVQYPSEVVRIHCPLDGMPKIYWGVE